MFPAHPRTILVLSHDTCAAHFAQHPPSRAGISDPSIDCCASCACDHSARRAASLAALSAV
eukprot:1952893-Pleurochrysis_carterae.AAC.2